MGLGSAPALAQLQEQQKLTASDAGDGDRLGIVVSTSGDTVLVGARDDDCAAGNFCGSAHIFHFNGTSWVEKQKLTASDVGQNDRFGNSVSVSGDTALVGASGNEAAYVFRFDGTSWVERQKLTAFDGAVGGSFGRAVSVSGSAALVGASANQAAYVYRFNGTSWAPEQKLVAVDVATSGEFGFSASLSGDTALIGARGAGAFVFRFNGTSWIQEQKLISPITATGDLFGFSVSLSGDTAVVGAGADVCAAGIYCGAVYVFRFDGTVWSQEQKLTASDPRETDTFGISVSVSGDTVVAGAYQFDCGTGVMEVNCGAAYVFGFDGASWVERQRLTASDAAGWDNFGISVAVSGDTTVVGAFQDECASGFACGAAYAFRGVPTGPIPTMSEWGLVSLIFLLLASATILIRRRVSIAR